MVKIAIKGDIVDNDSKWIYEFFGFECVTPKDVLNVLNEAEGEDIELEIASNGGDVFAASEIYTSLRKYQGKVSGDVVGLAASAASVIACSCDPLRVSPTGQIMIHNAWMRSAGNKKDKVHDADILTSIDESIINAYEMKTGKNRDELANLMDKETWLSAQKAIEIGFADEVMFAENIQIANTTTQFFSKESVTKLKNIVLEKERKQTKSLVQKKLAALRGEN